MFGAIAPAYDRMNHLLSLSVDRYWRWRTVRLVRPEGQAPILDVCTGTGDLAFAFARCTRGEVPIMATDFCPEMLAIGRSKSQRSAVCRNVTFLEADTQALPFAAGIFQIVCVAFGLRNVADTDLGLREMTRVCAPQGRVVILEFSMPRWQPMRTLYGWYFRRLLPRIGQLLVRNEDDAYRYLPESVREFPERAELVQRMEAAGLRDVHYHSLTGGIATLYVGVKL